MITGIYEVLGCGDLTQAPSQNQQGGMLLKRQIRLREFAGQSRYDSTERVSNAIVAAMLGELAKITFEQDDLVIVSLRFQIREYQGNLFQDVVVVDIRKI